MWNHGSTSWNRRANSRTSRPREEHRRAARRASRQRHPGGRPRRRCWCPRSCRPTEPLTFAELADECGLPKSTTSRLLTALERTELLERDDAGSYVAGPLFWRYATRHDPCERARPARPPGPRARSARRPARRSTSACRAATGSCRSPRSTPATCSAPATGPSVDVPPHASRSARCSTPYGALPLPAGAARAARPSARSPTAPRCAATSPASAAAATRATVDELELGLTGVAAPVRGGRRRGDRRPRHLRPHPTPGRAGSPPLGRLLIDQAAQLSALLASRRTTAKEGVA